MPYQRLQQWRKFQLCQVLAGTCVRPRSKSQLIRRAAANIKPLRVLPPSLIPVCRRVKDQHSGVGGEFTPRERVLRRHIPRKTSNRRLEAKDFVNRILQEFRILPQAVPFLRVLTEE